MWMHAACLAALFAAAQTSGADIDACPVSRRAACLLQANSQVTAISEADAQKPRDKVEASREKHRPRKMEQSDSDEEGAELVQQKEQQQEQEQELLEEEKLNDEQVPGPTPNPGQADGTADGAQPPLPIGASQDILPIAPFGKEDTAMELQNLAARTQDTLVDAVENAEVAEIKRSIFRSLTRLRAAQIKEFDTIARLETQAIDEYNDNHHYRKENPLQYIHSDEPGITEDKYTSFHD